MALQPATSLDRLWRQPLAVTSHRASSHQRDGANKDFWLIEPGKRQTLLELDSSSGTVRRIWFTLSAKANDVPDYLETTRLRFTFDGEKTPSIHGTGTEDYFGMAWGVHRPYQAHDHGVTRYQRNLTDHDRFYDGRFVLYRWHLTDPIVFRRSLHASIEAGHRNDCRQHYESVAIWYGRSL